MSDKNSSRVKYERPKKEITPLRQSMNHQPYGNLEFLALGTRLGIYIFMCMCVSMRLQKHMYKLIYTIFKMRVDICMYVHFYVLSHNFTDK